MFYMEVCDFLASPENAVLRALLNEGTITEDDVAQAMISEKEKYVEKVHKSKIYVDSQGRWRTYYTDPWSDSSGRKLLAKRDRRELISVLYDIYTGRETKAKKRRLTIEEMFDDWIDYKRLHGISEATILKYMSDWRCHLEGTPIVKRPISRITKAEMDEWAHKLIADNNMTKTDYINVSTLIRQPLDYAVDQEIISSNPLRKVKIEQRMFRPVKKKQSETQVFTRSELEALQRTAWEDMENPKLVHKLAPLAFLFMFQTGCRIGEVCAIKYEDIEGDELHLQRSVERDTHTIKEGLKGDRSERWVILSSEAKHILEEARRRQRLLGVPETQYVFSTDENYLTCRAVSEAFRRYCSRAGIEYRSSHKARKTFISSLIDGGMNINTIREMVGHADERTTMNSYCYDRRTRDERKAILERSLSL